MRRCPASQVDSGTAALMDLYRQYDRRNILPLAGSWLEQPAYFARLVQLVDAERSAVEKERQRLADIARKNAKSRKR